LEEQKLLLKDSNYTRTVRTWVKKEGQLTPVEKQQRILPWWRVNADGSYVLFVRSGSKTIEFEKGKNAVAVPSFDKVPLVIDILITAVRNGELDDQLAQAKKPPPAMTCGVRAERYYGRGLNPPFTSAPSGTALRTHPRRGWPDPPLAMAQGPSGGDENAR
jgi:hypothetical protein